MKNKKNGSSYITKVFWLSVGSILYTYFIYPILVWLLAHLCPKPKPYSPNYPNVTLLIAAYNEEKVIAEKLENCLDLDYPKQKLQILVVTDGSTDLTSQIVKHFPNDNIQLLHEPERRGKMAAINRAMPFALGEIIVFSDANNFYQAQTLKELVAPFQKPEIGAVSGAKNILGGDGNLGVSEGLYWKYESFIKQQESRLGSCTGVTGEILAVRRKLYKHPPDHIINDDFYIAMQIIRQGYRLVYAPAARSYERVSQSARDEIKRRQRIVAGRYQAIANASHLLPLKNPLVSWQIISHKFLRPLVPFAMIAALVSNVIVLFKPLSGQKGLKKFFSLDKPYSAIIFFLQSLFYGVAFWGSLIENQNKKSRLRKVLYLPTFLVNSNFAALKGLVQYLRRQQTTLWEKIPRRE